MKRISPHTASELHTPYTDVIEHWLAGQLSFKDAVHKLHICGGDAAAFGDQIAEGHIEWTLGEIQQQHGNIYESIQHYRRARSLYFLAHNYDGAAMAELRQGINYRFWGEIERARQVFRSAFEIATINDNQIIQTETIIQQGLACLDAQVYEQAQDNLELGVTLAKLLDDEKLRSSLLCKAYEGLAVIHTARCAPDAAWKEAMNLWALASETQDSFCTGYANRTVGRLRSGLDTSACPPEFTSDFDLYFVTAAGVFESIGDETEFAITRFVHARCLHQQGRIEDANQRLKKAVLIFARLGMYHNSDRAAQMVSQLH